MDEKGIQPSTSDASRALAVKERKEKTVDLPQKCGLTSDPESDEEDDDDANSIASTKSFEAQSISFIVENDRRYCDDYYYMPNDETEATRLNIIHQLYLILLDGNLTIAPLNKDAPLILDVGTGPGDWAVEMSGLFPSSTIIATDISIFDTGLAHIDLPNVSFQLDDAREEWTYHEPFDLIHLRGLSGAFDDWAAIYRQAFEHLSPGGYIEVADTDPAAGDTVQLPNNPQSKNSYFYIYTSAMRSAAEVAGYPRGLDHLHPDMLTAAGFVDVCVFERTLPIGIWPQDPQEKTLGKMALIAVLEGLEAYGLRPLTATARWAPEDVRDICEKVKGEFLSGGRITARVRFMTGRKPISRIQLKESRQRDVLSRALQKVEEGPA